MCNRGCVRTIRAIYLVRPECLLKSGQGKNRITHVNY